MDIIPSFLSDADIEYMDDSLILALGGVCNHIISAYIKSYMDNPEADKAVAERLKSLIGSTVTKNTFYREVIDNGTRDIINSFSLEAIAEQDLDLGMIYESIQYINKNKEKIIAQVDPRTKEEYTKFLEEAEKFDKKTGSFVSALQYPYLSKRIKANKRIFYSPNESATPTRMKAIINKYSELEIADKGIQYINYCREHGVSGYIKVEF